MGREYAWANSDRAESASQRFCVTRGRVSDTRAARELYRKAIVADELADGRRAERDAPIRRLPEEDPKRWSYGVAGGRCWVQSRVDRDGDEASGTRVAAVLRAAAPEHPLADSDLAAPDAIDQEVEGLLL